MEGEQEEGGRVAAWARTSGWKVRDSCAISKGSGEGKDRCCKGNRKRPRGAWAQDVSSPVDDRKRWLEWDWQGLWGINCYQTVDISMDSGRYQEKYHRRLPAFVFAFVLEGDLCDLVLWLLFLIPVNCKTNLILIQVTHVYRWKRRTTW